MHERLPTHMSYSNLLSHDELPCCCSLRVRLFACWFVVDSFGFLLCGTASFLDFANEAVVSALEDLIECSLRNEAAILVKRYSKGGDVGDKQYVVSLERCEAQVKSGCEPDAQPG